MVGDNEVILVLRETLTVIPSRSLVYDLEVHHIDALSQPSSFFCLQISLFVRTIL